MRILVNACSTVIGGGIQVATEFIRRMLLDPACESWTAAVSAEVARELAAFGTQAESRLIEISPAPSHSRASRRRLSQVANNLKPDAVYTVFGPAYARFSCPHICGVADPWVTHATSLAFRSLGLSAAGLKMPPRIIYKAFWFRAADYWVVEAPVARRGLSRRWFVDPDKVSVVPNNCGSHYLELSAIARPLAPGDTLRILCFCAYYQHKNMEILPKIASALRKRRPSLRFKIVITLPEIPASRILGLARRERVADCFENTGPVPVIEGPKMYQSSHIVLLPTVLETFSANYPEAMIMRRPIVTSDLDFAHDVCRDAAEYFDPTSGEDAVDKILRLVDDPVHLSNLIARGVAVQGALPGPVEKFKLMKRVIASAVGRESA